MYLKYEDYKKYTLGGGIAEEDFNKRYPRAELIYDDWTHNRCPEEWKQDETNAPIWLQESITIIIDNLVQMYDRDNVLTSYNNGKESFSFASSGITLQENYRFVYDYVKTLTPIDYISACVYY